MVILSKHYDDSNTAVLLRDALENILVENNREALFVCIGSDRHILDCFGPLAGSMIAEKIPACVVLGTLDKPLHAGNLKRELPLIEKDFPGRIKIAVDAATGKEEDIGVLRLKEGPLLPGKALSKRLPPVGDYSITGILGKRFDKRNKDYLNAGSFRNVYHMASLVSEAVYEIYNRSRDN
jgi:putative sporulation protein YyaC